MIWFLGNFQSWNVSTASLRTTALHCGVVSSRLLSQYKIREELLECPGRGCPCLSCGEGKPLSSWCWDAPCGGARCPVPGLWVCSCTGITEGVSGSAELRLHFCLFYLQQGDLGRRFPVNINIPKGLDSGRFLFFRGGTGTQAHTPPPTDCWMSGRHLEKVVGFDGFVILSLAVGCEQKVEAPASLSCRQGTDPRLS